MQNLWFIGNLMHFSDFHALSYGSYRNFGGRLFSETHRTLLRLSPGIRNRRVTRYTKVPVPEVRKVHQTPSRPRSPVSKCTASTLLRVMKGLSKSDLMPEVQSPGRPDQWKQISELCAKFWPRKPKRLPESMPSLNGRP